jgi:formylglycine-generating enzyme required for sulfatase activity
VAVGLWQAAQGLDVTGYLDQQQYTRLIVEAETQGLVSPGNDEPQSLEPGESFRDCDDCPEMVVVPSGSFMMGSPASERQWAVDHGGKPEWFDHEGLQHRVSIGYEFAVGSYEITRGEFAAFVNTTGHDAGNQCWTYEDGEAKVRSGRNWRNVGYSQNDSHPVACVNWDDARAYVNWLSRKTGEDYRLLSEAEWEYVARAGTTMRHWGDDRSNRAGCGYANGADAALKRQFFEWTVMNCDDGSVYTSAVGRYEANEFKLHDMIGNVLE